VLLGFVHRFELTVNRLVLNRRTQSFAAAGSPVSTDQRWPMIYGLPKDYRRHSTVMGVFSTITSPVFSELPVIVLTDDAITYLPEDATLFETLGKMNQVRPFNLVFNLVLSFNVSESSLGEA